MAGLDPAIDENADAYDQIIDNVNKLEIDSQSTPTLRGCPGQARA
jgi:hypothetical protein